MCFKMLHPFSSILFPRKIIFLADFLICLIDFKRERAFSLQAARSKYFPFAISALFEMSPPSEARQCFAADMLSPWECPCWEAGGWEGLENSRSVQSKENVTFPHPLCTAIFKAFCNTLNLVSCTVLSFFSLI